MYRLKEEHTKPYEKVLFPDYIDVMLIKVKDNTEITIAPFSIYKGTLNEINELLASLDDNATINDASYIIRCTNGKYETFEKLAVRANRELDRITNLNPDDLAKEILDWKNNKDYPDITFIK